MRIYGQEIQKRALVVEDDLWMQPLLSAALQSAIPGVIVDWTSSAEEAIRRTRLFTYQVIIADIHLSPNRGSGWDFWYSCREECPGVPVILTSAVSSEALAEKIRVYNPHYIPKPFSVSQCKEVISNLVSSR